MVTYKWLVSDLKLKHYTQLFIERIATAMPMHRYLPAPLILLLPCFLFAQEIKPVADLSRADSVALSTKYYGDIFRLTKQLTGPFPAEILKVRAIFRWITDNIAYDFKYYNRYAYRGREPKGFTCEGDSMDCAIKQNVWEIAYVNKVLDKKKAVCQGYAMLFKKMCEIAHIDAEVLPGYVRTEYYEIGGPGTLDHAWNAVRIDGVYYLLDATWAAGGCAKDDDGKLISFQKDFRKYYWLTPPEDLARNHFPENVKWVLLKNYTIKNFSSNPYYSPDDIGIIKLITPQTGTIVAKRGDTIHFKLRYRGLIRDLQVNSNIFQNPDIYYWEQINKRTKIPKLDTLAVKKQRYVQFERNNDTYTFDYVAKDRTLEYLDLIFDTRRVMRFKVSVH